MSDTPSPSRWSATSVMPTLDVDDLERAITFYASIGFVEKWRYPDPAPAYPLDGNPDVVKRHWTHAGVALGDVGFMLAADRCDGPIHRQNVYVFMKDVRGYHDYVRKVLGESSVPDLESQDYGMVDFSLRDPWGHLLTFGEATEE